MALRATLISGLASGARRGKRLQWKFPASWELERKARSEGCPPCWTLRLFSGIRLRVQGHFRLRHFDYAQPRAISPCRNSCQPRPERRRLGGVGVPYSLCRGHGVRPVLEWIDEGTYNASVAECTGHPRHNDEVPPIAVGAGTTGVICEIDEDICVDGWIEVDAYLVANVFPSREHGAELLAWGFAAVVGPALILWLGVVVVRGIRSVFGGR